MIFAFLIAILEDTTKNGQLVYSVRVPDLPGCFTRGETIVEAKENAIKAIARHMDNLLRAGGSLPNKISFFHHSQRRELKSAYFCYVKIDLSKPVEAE
jgi:predicted RNase H-like HicB family nuclease